MSYSYTSPEWRKMNIIKNRTYRKTKKYKKTYAKWVDNPKRKERQKAYRCVYKAIKNGFLIRLPCEICGKKKAEAHHNSYLPKDVLRITWMCKLHHEEWHMNHVPIYST